MVEPWARVYPDRLQLCRLFAAPDEVGRKATKGTYPMPWQDIGYVVGRAVVKRSLLDSGRYHFMPMVAFFWYDAVSVSLPFGMFLQVNVFAGQRSRISPLHRILPFWRRSQPYL